MCAKRRVYSAHFSDRFDLRFPHQQLGLAVFIVSLVQMLRVKYCNSIKTFDQV